MVESLAISLLPTGANSIIYRVRQRIGRFGNSIFFFYFYLKRERGLMLPRGVAVNSVQFEMELWAGAQHAFALKSF